MKKKKILVLASTFPRWKHDTIPPFVFELEKRLAKDFEIHILAPHFYKAKKYEEWENLKIHRYQYFWPARWENLCYGGGILPNIKKNYLLAFQLPFLIISALFSLAYLTKKHRINGIHAHWIVPGGLIAVFYKVIFNNDLKILISAHSSYYRKILAFFPLDKLYKWVVIHSTITTTVSNDMKTQLSKVTGLQHRVISMGVDPSLFLNGEPSRDITKKYGENLMLFVGRLVESKGIHFLIDVMRKVVEIKPRAVLLVIGQGTDEQILREKIKKYNLSKNVYLLGAIPQKELVSYYQTAKIFIVPSRAESFGLVFAEAMICECLVISSDLKSISDVVIDGKTGFQLNTSDINQFTKKLLHIYDHYKQYDALRKAGRAHVLKNYSWNVITKKYYDIYKSL